jgi:hypothetical protein
MDENTIEVLVGRMEFGDDYSRQASAVVRRPAGSGDDVAQVPVPIGEALLDSLPAHTAPGTSLRVPANFFEVDDEQKLSALKLALRETAEQARTSLTDQNRSPME